MPKLLTRIVALLLVPCLIAETLSASPFLSVTAGPSTFVTSITPFQQQAMALPPDVSIRPGSNEVAAELARKTNKEKLDEVRQRLENLNNALADILEKTRGDHSRLEKILGNEKELRLKQIMELDIGRLLGHAHSIKLIIRLSLRSPSTRVVYRLRGLITLLERRASKLKERNSKIYELLIEWAAGQKQEREWMEQHIAAPEKRDKKDHRPKTPASFENRLEPSRSDVYQMGGGEFSLVAELRSHLRRPMKSSAAAPGKLSNDRLATLNQIIAKVNDELTSGVLSDLSQAAGIIRAALSNLSNTEHISKDILRIAGQIFLKADSIKASPEERVGAPSLEQVKQRIERWLSPEKRSTDADTTPTDGIQPKTGSSGSKTFFPAIPPKNHELQGEELKHYIQWNAPLRETVIYVWLTYFVPTILFAASLFTIFLNLGLMQKIPQVQWLLMGIGVLVPGFAFRRLSSEFFSKDHREVYSIDQGVVKKIGPSDVTPEVWEKIQSHLRKMGASFADWVSLLLVSVGLYRLIWLAAVASMGIVQGDVPLQVYAFGVVPFLVGLLYPWFSHWIITWRILKKMPEGTIFPAQPPAAAPADGAEAGTPSKLKTAA